MKLRNKKTGEIGYLIADKGSDYYVVDKHGYNCGNKYNSLAELTEEWEDYEEPKDTFWIDNEGTVCGPGIDYSGNLFKKNKEIGNYFETREEAEKAVEKLKALAEAKEDGLKIKGYYYNHEDLVILADIGKCNKLTLDELFGKEID